MIKKLALLWVTLFLILAGCAPASTISGSGQPVLSTPAAVAYQPVANSNNQAVAQSSPTQAASKVDLTHLPIGDGRVSSQPQTGYIWSCQTNFGAGGAGQTGNWVNGDGSFNLTTKPSVDGSVNWPSSFTISLQGSQRVIAGNDLPNHPTGNFPISSGDDAFAYDRNPNSIKSQTISLSLPANPTMAAAAHCLPGGPIGVLLSGAYLFDALDAGGRDAVAHEIQDNCQGHPQQSGLYHYHDLTSCIPDTIDASGNSPLVGYALDGFGIFGPVQNGRTLTRSELDACHGTTSEIEWDGQRVTMYHYVATADYPYTMGCFRGQPVLTSSGRTGGPAQPQQNGNLQPRQDGGLQSQDGQERPRIDLATAAGKLGVTEDALRAALGDASQGRPDLATAAAKLGVTEQQLIDALGLPAGGPLPPQAP